jgi:hypothetical protein
MFSFRFWRKYVNRHEPKAKKTGCGNCSPSQSIILFYFFDLKILFSGNFSNRLEKKCILREMTALRLHFYSTSKLLTTKRRKTPSIQDVFLCKQWIQNFSLNIYSLFCFGIQFLQFYSIQQEYLFNAIWRIKKITEYLFDDGMFRLNTHILFSHSHAHTHTSLIASSMNNPQWPTKEQMSPWEVFSAPDCNKTGRLKSTAHNTSLLKLMRSHCQISHPVRFVSWKYRRGRRWR